VNLNFVRKILASASRSANYPQEVQRLKDEFWTLFEIDVLDDFRYEDCWVAYHFEDHVEKLIFFPEEAQECEDVEILLRRYKISGDFSLVIRLELNSGVPEKEWKIVEMKEGFLVSRQYSDSFRLTLIIRPADDC